MKSFAKQWLPPTLISRLKPILRRGIYFSGSYSNWAAAEAASDGYEVDAILERVIQARLRVLAGQGVYERDSVVFDAITHSYPVLAGLLRAASEDVNHLSVLDFGGSLGSTYFQCREFLSVVKSLKWGVVEQSNFVAAGRDKFETDQLAFYLSIDECVKEASPNVALFSSVLQYLRDPYDILNRVVSTGINYIIVDRTPFSDNSDDHIGVQHVPPEIYRATYPIRIFGRRDIFALLRSHFDVIVQFESNWDGSSDAFCDGVRFYSRGMILRRK